MLKTDSPIAALPLHDDTLWIHIARDPRDAGMSHHNHMTKMADTGLAARNGKKCGKRITVDPKTLAD